jgi:hypothetical protein
VPPHRDMEEEVGDGAGPGEVTLGSFVTTAGATYGFKGMGRALPPPLAVAANVPENVVVDEVEVPAGRGGSEVDGGEEVEGRRV